MFLACVWRILIQLFVCFSFLDSQTFPSSPPTQLIGAYYLFLAVLIFNIVDNFWARLIDFHNCEQWLLAVVQCSSSSSSSSTSSSGAHKYSTKQTCPSSFTIIYCIERKPLPSILIEILLESCSALVEGFKRLILYLWTQRDFNSHFSV